MQNIVKSAAMAAGVAVALSLFGSAVASASSGHESNADVKVSTTPPSMELSTSEGEQIRTTGTQGTIASATQGTIASSDQCTDSSTTKVACITPSSQAAPQLKAK